MRGPLRLLLCGVVLLWLAPAAVQAQSSAAPSQPPAADTAPADPGNFWFGVGGAYVVRRGDCTTCEQDFPFLHDMGLLIDIGRRINPQMDVAAEVYWTPTSSSDDRANVTHLDAIAQYRLWKSHGFFLKGGAGMALVRNWVDVTGGGHRCGRRRFPWSSVAAGTSTPPSGSAPRSLPPSTPPPLATCRRRRASSRTSWRTSGR